MKKMIMVLAILLVAIVWGTGCGKAKEGQESKRASEMKEQSPPAEGKDNPKDGEDHSGHNH